MKLTATTTFATGLAGARVWADQVRSGDMIYRTLGSTGVQVSAIGLGGYHIGNPVFEAESTKIVRSAIDRGITFMDNCWDYHNGESERRMGLALGHGVSRTLHTGRMSPKENDCHEG